MFSHLKKAALALSFAMVCASASLADTADQAVEKALDGFERVTDGVGSSVKSPMDLVPNNFPADMNLLEDSQDVTLRWDRSRWLEGDIGRVGIFDVESIGWADDSTRGSRLRFVVSEQTNGTYKVLGQGKQVMCYRGENKGKWTTGLCP